MCIDLFSAIMNTPPSEPFPDSFLVMEEHNEYGTTPDITTNDGSNKKKKKAELKRW